jgi:hypothetical protein
MPPKDPVASASLIHQRLDFQMSPASSPASFRVFHAPDAKSRGETLSVTAASPFLEMERVKGQQQQTLPTTFRLLPRASDCSCSENSSTPPPASSEIPVFLDFLNKLHGGELPQQHLLHAQSPTMTAVPAASKKAKTEPSNRRRVHFATPNGLQRVHPIVSRHDTTTLEKQSTWYTEQYLRTKGQVVQAEETTTSSSSSSSNQPHRDLLLAGLYIRRSRKVVLTEQARHAYMSNHTHKSKEESIREVYHKATLHCQREAKQRGEAAAREAATLK